MTNPKLDFPDQSASFALGFEAGRIWQALHEDPEQFTFAIHAENTELVIQMAEKVERTVTFGESEGNWCIAIFGTAY